MTQILLTPRIIHIRRLKKSNEQGTSNEVAKEVPEADQGHSVESEVSHKHSASVVVEVKAS